MPICNEERLALEGDAEAITRNSSLTGAFRPFQITDLIRRNGWRALSFWNEKAVRAFSAPSRLTFAMKFGERTQVRKRGIDRGAVSR